MQAFITTSPVLCTCKKNKVKLDRTITLDIYFQQHPLVKGIYKGIYLDSSTKASLLC